MKHFLILIAMVMFGCDHGQSNINSITSNPFSWNTEKIEPTTESDTLWGVVDSVYLNHFEIPAHGIAFDGDEDLIKPSRHVVEHRGSRVCFTVYWSRYYEFPRIQYTREETYVGMENEDSLFIVKYYSIE